jgi:hypothetical protein
VIKLADQFCTTCLHEESGSVCFEYNGGNGPTEVGKYFWCPSWAPKPGQKTPDPYTTKFTEVLNQVLQLARGTKTADYGETWARTGLLGCYIKIFIKEGRLRELIWKNKAPQVGETVRDTLLDLAAYAVYGVICVDENNLTGQESEAKQLRQLALEIAERLGETEAREC